MRMITERDIAIFRTLSCGPMTNAQIRAALKGMQKKDPNRVDDKGSPITTEKALRNRISRLMIDGYIISRRYIATDGKGINCLYALGDNGVNELVKAGDKRKHIRTTLPGDQTVAHEMQVVAAVKTIKREAGQLLYQSDIEDENFQKQQSKGAKKGTPYPDVLVKLRFETSSGKKSGAIALEIDNDTMDGARVVGKAITLYKQMRIPIIILCPTEKRVNELTRAFARYHEVTQKKAGQAPPLAWLDDFMGSVAINLIGTFCHKGFCGITWQSVGGKYGIRIVPQDAKSTKR